MRRIVFFFVAALAFSASASPISIVEPRNGATLRGGSIATIRWTATAPLPRGAEEWEAFLSVDGGAYYAARITPHLDIDIRAFAFRVPNVASKSVRLLIRMGDEREETAFELPLTLSIEATPGAGIMFPSRATTRGEAARPGDREVVEWASGDRRGRGLLEERDHAGDRVVATHARPSAKRHAVPRRSAAAARSSKAISSAFAVHPRCERIASPLLTRDLLLLNRRRNI